MNTKNLKIFIIATLALFNLVKSEETLLIAMEDIGEGETEPGMGGTTGSNTSEPAPTDLPPPRDDYIKCPPLDEREDPNNYDCADKSQPVCAQVSKCQDDYCELNSVTFLSECHACKDVNVATFSKGECSNDSTSSISKRDPYVCQDSDRNIDISTCPREEGPVCGAVENCNSKDEKECYIQYDNKCLACNKSGIGKVSFSPCFEDLEEPGNLVDPRPEPEPLPNKEPPKILHCAFLENGQCSSNKSCGYKKNCNYAKEGEKCFEEFDSGCDACSDSSINLYEEGECPNVTTCSPDEENTFCPAIFIVNGVCAFKDPLSCGSNSECSVKVGSPCQGCSASNKFVIDKDCNSLFNYVAEVMIDPIPIFAPAQKQECKERSDICAEIYIQTCGYKTGCVKDECEKQYGNPCEACGAKDADGNYVNSEYIEGACSFAQGGLTEEKEEYLVDTNANNGSNIKYYTATTTADVDVAKAENAQYDEASQEYFEAVVCTERPTGCDAIVEETCAFKKCSSGFCPVDVSNKCVACTDATTTYYVPSKCSNVGTKRVYHKCSADQKSSTCSGDFRNNIEICATKESGSTFNLKSDLYANYNSICEACSDSNTNTFYEGECSSNFIVLSLSVILTLLLLV